MAMSFGVGDAGRGVTVDAEQLYALQVAFKASGKEAMKEARTITNKIGRAMQAELKGAGMVGQGPLAAHVAAKGVKYERRQVFKGKDGTVRASKFTGGYVPVVAIGLDAVLPVERKATPNNPHPTAAEVWAGTEFGSKRPLPGGGRRFRPRRKDGYWFFPTWRQIKDTYARQWQDAMNDLLKKWEISGGGLGG